MFIAMWFDESMKNARQAITEAIENLGFGVSIIDMKEHNNQIVPEILHEIKNCKFVIADFTGNRGGVYYEAGYALALGKEVIHTCKSENFKDLHFDILQKNTISWSDEKELKNRLIKIIEATILS